MKMLKVFISQRMHGRTDEAVMAEREEAERKIKASYPDCSIKVIDQFHVNDAPENAGRLFYLGHSVQLISEADLVYFCKGWREANGCIIEWEICKRYGIPYVCENGI